MKRYENNVVRFQMLERFQMLAGRMGGGSGGVQTFTGKVGSGSGRVGSQEVSKSHG